jgi:hypothetical protein
LQITDRSGHWITEQVGRRARSVSEVAKELIRSLYDHENEELALTFITRRGHDFNNDQACSEWPSVSDRSQLPGAATFRPLRRQAQLVTTRDHHPPLKSEEPLF